jgi:ribonuclease P protein component
MSLKSFAFPKCERMTSKKEIDTLFLTGEAFFVYPFKVICQIREVKTETFETLQVLISVPKRNFKRANKRNHFRRLMKEAYRLNKQSLQAQLKSTNQSLRLVIVYHTKEELSYQTILPKVIQVLNKLEEKASLAT